MQTTVTNIHDSDMDLANEGKVRYGDEGDHDAKPEGYDASMKRAARDIRSAILMNCETNYKRRTISSGEVWRDGEKVYGRYSKSSFLYS